MRKILQISMRYLLMLILLLSPCLKLLAQSKTVTGRVNDAKTGEALIGATINVKGTTNGVAANVNGEFKISATPGAVLEVKSVGYETTTVNADFTRPMVITLSEDVKALSEVVVVGYGSQKKETLTGSVATVSAKAFQDRGPIENPISALQGTVPGTVVTRTSAAPGRAGWSIQIRGATSTNGSSPLYIIDGVPVSVAYNTGNGTILSNNSNSTLGATQNAENALGSLNPDDIESISVLKDASAAIYGARGAGGVVLITTKRGKGGKPTVQYDGSLSVKAIGLSPTLANNQQYGEGMSQAVANDYVANGGSPANNLWYKLGLSYLSQYNGGFIDLTKDANGNAIAPANNPLNPGFGDVKDLPLFNTNALDQLYHNALSTSHSVSLTGSGEKSAYRVSFSYLNDGSLLKYGNNSNNRYTLRLSHDYAVSEKFKIATTISFEENDIVMPTRIGSVEGQFSQPGLPAFNINGDPYAWGTQITPAAQAKFGGDNREYNTRIYGNLKLNYTFNKHFDFVAVGGYTPSFSNVYTQGNVIHWYNYLGNYQYVDNPTQANSFAQRQLTKDSYFNVNAYLNYHQTFAKDHNVGVTVGSSFEKDKNDYFSATTNNIASYLVPVLSLGLGDATTRTDDETAAQYAIASYFGRFNYNYKGKYLLEANARLDGSSKFTAENRYKFFYGFSAGWVLSEEQFVKRLNIFDVLKIRASYGQVGNQNGIGLYDYINNLAINYAKNNVNGPPIIGTSTAVQVTPNSTLVSVNRTWETIATDNIGLDFSLLNSRLSGSFDYFIKNNTNMLLGQTLPAVLGASAPQANLGHLKTWGWESALTWKDKVGKVTYHIGVNISDNQNKLVNYGGANIISAGYNGAVEGYPIGSYFGLQYTGRVQTQAQADAVNAMNAGNNIGMPAKTATNAGVRIGDNMFADVNGDGKLTTPGDLVYLGRDDPRYVGSVNLGFEWHGFDVNTVWTGVAKRTIFRNGTWRVPFGSIFQGQEAFWYGNTWTPANTSAYYPILSGGQNGTSYNNYNYQISTWSVENGAYLRLKNLVVGYTIPQSITKKAGLSRVRVYFSGTDLVTFSHIRDGFDPEQTRTIGQSGGTGLERYPFYKFITGGLSVTF